MTRSKTKAIASSLSKEQLIFWRIQAGMAVAGAVVFVAMLAGGAWQ